LTVTTLEDDIARIAALRGKPTNYYTDPALRPERPLSQQLLDNLFSMPPSPERDLRFYDQLPDESRRFVSEAPLPINAAVYGALIQNAGGSEERVASVTTARLPGQMKAWLLRHFGRDHPNLRKYA